jgi:hypothetical protein
VVAVPTAEGWVKGSQAERPSLDPQTHDTSGGRQE